MHFLNKVFLNSYNYQVRYMSTCLQNALLMIILFLSFSTFAQTHCQPNEFIFLSGKFGKIDKKGEFIGSKFMSLCADKKEGITKLDYRFGLIDKVEMNFSSPVDGKFNFTSKQIMPRASVDVLYFTKGQITYAITDCQGMHCSSTFNLLVFSGDKRVAKFVSEPDKINGDHFNFKTSNIFVEKNSKLNFDDTD